MEELKNFAKVHEELEKLIRPNHYTEIDRNAMIIKSLVASSFLNYNGFRSLCISINDEVSMESRHETYLKEGDIVSPLRCI